MAPELSSPSASFCCSLTSWRRSIRARRAPRASSSTGLVVSSLESARDGAGRLGIPWTFKISSGLKRSSSGMRFTVRHLAASPFSLMMMCSPVRLICQTANSSNEPSCQCVLLSLSLAIAYFSLGQFGQHCFAELEHMSRPLSPGESLIWRHTILAQG